jgi:hypothetical protein
VSEKTKLRWHQLSLRSIMVAITATAIGLGIRSDNRNIIYVWLVVEFLALGALLALFEWWMEMRQLREEARQREFWRRFEKAQEEFRKASP